MKKNFHLHFYFHFLCILYIGGQSSRGGCLKRPCPVQPFYFHKYEENFHFHFYFHHGPFIMVEGVVSEEELPWLARLRYSGNHSHYRPGQGVLDQSTITIKNLKPNKLAFHYCPKSYCVCLLVVSNRLSPSLCW